MQTSRKKISWWVWLVLGVVLLVLASMAISSFFQLVQEESKERARQEEIARLRQSSGTQPSRHAPPALVATEWVWYSAPPQGQPPITFPQYVGGWDFQVEVPDGEKGNIEYVGSITSSDGKVRFRLR